MKELKIEYKNVNDIIPYENNPRVIEKAVDAVAKSIEEFGFKNPIILDKANVIVAGHTRLKAAEKLGIEKVPVIYADDLTEDQVKAFRLADNKVSEFSEWDFDKLEKELESVDMDLSDFGFNSADICLDVNDEDFLTDTEITKTKEPKKVICPECGKEFEI